jgi:hypothetical protein
MKRAIFLFLFSTLYIYSQSRNGQVRILNSIIDYMDESSRINRLLYWDIDQFAEGYIHSSGPKKNNNYWYTHSRPDGRVGPFDKDKGRFPELHVDAEGMISDFEFELYPYLEARENIDKLLTTKFFSDSPDKITLKIHVLEFKSTMDSLVTLHKSLYDYVVAKSYLNDPEFKTALNIIDQTSKILDRYRTNAYMLYKYGICEHYDRLPVLKTQRRIIQAEGEAVKIMKIFDVWEQYLYIGDASHTHELDSLMRWNNEQSLAKDSIIFYGSYGYGASNNGAMPHTRYTIFYGMMQSTAYWYAKDKYGYPDYMRKSDINYNQFVDRTHMTIEDYDDLVECADGMQLSKNMDYSMKMAAQVGVDTNQHVMLKHPRWGYLFHFVKKEEEKPMVVVVEKKDTALTEHQQLINKSLPHHMVFLLDISASMNEPGKLDLLKEGTKYLVGLQRNKDHISLLTFSTHSHTLLRNVSCDQKENIHKKIDELHAHGATNASDGVRNSFGIADSNHISQGKNKIILVTDGKFSLDADASKLLLNFKKKNIELVILLVGSKDDPQLEKDFDKTAKKGNGRFYKVSANNIQDILIKEASD